MTLTLVRHEDVAAVKPESNDVRAIYEQHHALVFRLGLRYGHGDAEWANDLAHDVFVELFAHPDRLEGVENVAAWLYRVTTNRCINRLRRERLMQSGPVRWLLETKAAIPPDPETLGIVDERVRQVFVAVNAMAPNARACFFMYYVDGKNQVEIGEILGCTKSYVCRLLSGVKQRLHRLGLGEGVE